IVDFDHPVHGAMKVAGFPVQFSETSCAIQRRAPELGEHTCELLRHLCEYSQTEIEEMLREGVIASSKSPAGAGGPRKATQGFEPQR
ncbi:MAG: CoA transferase, partial [Nitrospinota bacterium]